MHYIKASLLYVYIQSATVHRSLLHVLYKGFPPVCLHSICYSTQESPVCIIQRLPSCTRTFNLLQYTVVSCMHCTKASLLYAYIQSATVHRSLLYALYKGFTPVRVHSICYSTQESPVCIIQRLPSCTRTFNLLQYTGVSCMHYTKASLLYTYIQSATVHRSLLNALYKVFPPVRVHAICYSLICYCKYTDKFDFVNF